MTGSLAVTFPARRRARAIANAIGTAARVIYLVDLHCAGRTDALSDGECGQTLGWT